MWKDGDSGMRMLVRLSARRNQSSGVAGWAACGGVATGAPLELAVKQRSEKYEQHTHITRHRDTWRLEQVGLTYAVR